MTTPVKPEPISRVLTGDEWEAAQYAPHRLTSDPKKPLPPGRVLTGDEWEQAQRSGSLRKQTFPAMPKFAADATRRLNPNSGEQDLTPFEYLGDAIYTAATDLDRASAMVPVGGGVLQLAGILGRQVVTPMVEHPLMTAAMMNPVGAVAGGMMAAHTVAKYGWQVAHEAKMTPEERAEALKDPDRVSGEAAAVQGIMLGLGAIAGVHAVRSARTAGDFGAGMMEAGAKGLEGFKDPFGGDALKTVELKEAVKASGRRYFETEKGAEVLGTTAGAHGLPETASPFPPASALDVAWKQGHSASAPKPPAEPVDAAGFTQSHKNAYRVEQDAAGLRLISPDEALRMSPEELRAYADQVRAGEKNLEGQALDPETLKRFKAAERKANSQFAPAEETDAAVKVMQEIEDQMTPIQRLRMYGHRELDYTTAEDARAMADAAERVRPEVFIADEQAGHPVPTESLLSDVGRLITTGNANLGHSIEHPAALIQLRGTVAELQRRGMTTDQILKTALEERVRRGYATPDQALELAKARLEKLQSGGLFGAKPTEPVPQITEGQLMQPPKVVEEPKVKSTGYLDTEQTRKSYVDAMVGGFGTVHLAPTDLPVLGKTRTGLNIQKAQVHKGFDVTDVINGRNVRVATIRFDNGKLEHLAVRDAYQGKGIATDLLKFAKEQGYEISKSNLAKGPVSDAGAAVVNKFLAVEPTEPVAPPVTPEAVPSGSVAPPAGAVGLAPIEGTGKVRTRGLSRNIEAKALANNLSEAFGDLPEYRQLDLDNQAQFALDFIERDPAAARRVAMGQENAPQGLSPASVLVELENRATIDGDPSLVHDLATGRLAEQGTTMGQFIRILGERNRESPVAAVQSLANRRKGGAKAGRFIQRAIKDIEKHTGINADQIAELINSLRC